MTDTSTLWPAELRPTRRHRAPRLRRGTMRRERLLRRLGESAHVPVTLVIAPAGYGKTTLLVHWLQGDARPLTWLTIDRADDDPEQLIASLALALGEPADLTLAALAYAVECREQPFVLTLDDVHHLQSAEALAVVDAIADAVPPGSQVVLAGRCEPELRIGRLRAQGRLIELRAPDLVMTRREAAKMLSLAGLELPLADVQVLLERTEGWPAGLYIAALSLRGRTDLHGAVERFGGDDRMLADYLRDELFDGLDAERRRFLERTSVLDELSGPLCDAVLRRTASGVALRSMARSNLLVVPLDHADTSYRYHGLLAAMLRTELRRTDPACEAELHRRASCWYAAAGDADRAIEHAIAGVDLARAGELLWATAGRVLDGRAADVRRWLARLTPEQIASEPTLALTAAAHHLVAGERDLVEHWTAVAGRTLGGDDAPSLEAGAQTMRAAVARTGIAAMQRDAVSSRERLPEDSPWQSLCCLLDGVATHLQGDADRGRHQLEEGARRGAIVAPVVQALCLAQLALIAIDDGDWERAHLLAARARSQVERGSLDGHPTCALVFAVSAFVRAHRDRVEDAKSDRRRATELLTQLVDYVPWYDGEVRLVLARTALRLGDVTGTRTLLAEAARELEPRDEIPVLRIWIDELWAQVEAFTVTELVGPSSLTTAELRVLALMPTHLSFREMGRRLHVSANTVKTHAHAVYRKLDVCSRSEAVLRARSTGLLDEA
ncbi:MAG TPA: LuxR C-terminal-related transcriptional regulator [Solirubrobacteraceae bacterium]|nr:LuxR C-terminal-related transcriptional regulator [Solirubrobacteraceae bacterium]